MQDETKEAEDIRTLVQSELDKITSFQLKSDLAESLIEPVQETRKWVLLRNCSERGSETPVVQYQQAQARDGRDAEKARDNIFGNAPAWFAPKAVGHYEVWVVENERDRNFKVLIDSASGHMFVHDYVV